MTITAPEPQVGRDRYGRPLVVPPGGGKPVAYTRCTTFVGALEDTYNLARWQMRMVAVGLVDRPDLHLAAAAHRDDKDRLNEVCEQAVEAAKGHAAATTGTALHALTEQVDRGQPPTTVPDAYRADIDAYVAATAGLEVVAVEQFGVHDGLKVGGTWDRIYRLPDGRLVVGDLKTGSIQWGMGKIAMQLAVYSRCAAYRPDGTRTPTGVDPDLAVVVHLPAGTGTCELVWVDVAAGWADVDLARAVREHRARKDWTAPDPLVRPPAADPADLIAAAGTVEALHEVWRAHSQHWTPDLTALAAARKTLLQAGAA